MKRWVPTGVVVIAVVAMVLHGPIAQLDGYHEFADRRAFLGIANAADVLSNVAFALVALWGLGALRGAQRDPRLGAALPGYRAFLAAVLLTAFGSSYYHLAPDNQRLVWDRLPIALACAGLLAAVRAETRAAPQSRWVLRALMIAAVASVLWWAITESRGAGDLRPYLLMQGAPLLLIPLWQALHGAPRAERAAFGVAILLYALAKAAELSDAALFSATGFVSGHTLKHLLAAAAGAVITASVVRRYRLASASL